MKWTTLFLLTFAILALVCTGCAGESTANAAPSSADISAPVRSAVFSPSPASTQTHIAITSSPTEPTEPSPSPSPLVIAPGTTDPVIASIQQRLMDLDYMDEDEPTEYFGPATKDAIIRFQRKNDLQVDGYIGVQTYAMLKSPDAKKYTLSVGDQGDDVKELQVRLRELDYMKKATGTFGEETEAAVKLLQERNNLVVDGKVGSQTRELLYSEDVRAFALSYGDESEEIKSLQARLQALAYLTTEPDGKYGSDTVSAVKRFQEMNGLVVDGHLGPSTKAALRSKNAQSNALAIGAQGGDVRRVQKRLAELKYMKGNSTGYFGSETEAAVRAFQKRNNLTVDGKVGPQTMRALTSDHAKKASSTPSKPGNNQPQDKPNDSTDTGGASVSAFIKAAESKLGSQYVRGAKGPNKFDCSGLVYWCLNKAGVKQSYMTSYTWRSCKKYQRIESMSSVKRGDVLVFKLGARKGHVGIAVSGSEMIDASNNKGQVVRRTFKSPFWTGSFYCAYRIF